PPIQVDGYDLGQIQTEISNVLGRYRNTTWWVNLTCGSKVMSLGAYEAAKLHPGTSVWYLDSNHRQVISLQGNPPGGDVFRLTVSEYLTAYRRMPMKTSDDPFFPKKLALAELFFNQSEKIAVLKKLLGSQNAESGTQDQYSTLKLPTSDRWIIQACQMAKEANLIQSLSSGFEFLTLKVIGHDFWKFVNGTWFEFIVWNAARKAGCFDDVKMDVEIPGKFGLNQLDLAATFSANLLIAECKTDANPFRSKASKERLAEQQKTNPGYRPDPEKIEESGTAYLDKLNSVSSLIGGSFVTKVFICTANPPNPQKNPGLYKTYEQFCSQAVERQIVIVTGDQLHQLPAILHREGKNPTYPRT
ncbi:MAG TPA: DUF1887 family CARF protein, partial [Acidobacteriota bacterium]|nr:DUF1887 family CARF protein [Acidobacteriota bacterium]